jgi:CRISPR-associated protein Csb3
MEMAESSIPVDLFNPGQVFACLGFVEAAEVLCGDADGVFDWSDSSNVRFLLRADGTESPVKRVLQFLSEAEVVAECPFGSHNASAWTASWGVLQTRAKEAPYPFPDGCRSAHVTQPSAHLAVPEGSSIGYVGEYC